MINTLSLISGGIDSAVSSYIILKEKFNVDFIHFDNQPLADKASLEKTKKLIKILAKQFKKKFKLYIVPHGKNHQELLTKTNFRYHCVLCRRLMYRIAERIAEKENYQYLITGENLGQVASQTLNNLAAETYNLKITILRPLLCYDKEEIIKLAKKIGTFEKSIQPGMCCNAVPKNPVTKAKIKNVKEQEKNLKTDKIIKQSIKNTKIIEIK